MTSKYMIVISFDAVSSEDLDILKTLPNFKKLMEGGSVIKNVDSIYPTLTYPAHATIVTGKYPSNHGIIDNTIFKMGDFVPDWYWYRKYLKGETIYDLAKKNGLKTCSLLWPVTARSGIDFCMPEIFPTKSYHNQMLMSATSGTVGFQLDLNKRFGNLRKGIEQPELDNFVVEAAKYTIKKHKPNLTLIHFTDVDTNRHHYGYSNSVIDDAFKRHDKRLGEIIDSLKEAGIYDESTIVALGDHSQLDANKIIKINKVLYENGLITLKNGKVTDYRAISKSLDGSAYIYLKNNKDNSTFNTVKSLLNNIIEEDKSSIEFILEKDEIKEAGADSKASFMVEGGLGYYFVDDLDGDVIENLNIDDIKIIPHRYKGIHGYSPKKENYGTFFIGYGVGFKAGVVLNKGKLINHGPTIAKILGFDMKAVDGEVVEEILNL